jgi:hypothetical protein
VVDLLNTSTDPLLKLYNATLKSTQGLAYDAETSTLWEFKMRGVRVFSVSFASERLQLRLTHTKPFNFSTDLPFVKGRELAHIGGVDFVVTSRGRELWLAAHTARPYEGALVALDADTLTYNGIVIYGDYKSLDWIAFHPQTKLGYFGHFVTVDVVKRFNVETLQMLDDLDVQLRTPAQFPPQYIQSAGFDRDSILNLVGDDYQIRLYRFNVDTGELLSVQSLLAGNEVDGLTFINKYGKMLIGYNRLHSHEKTWLCSIIQYDILPSQVCRSATVL